MPQLLSQVADHLDSTLFPWIVALIVFVGDRLEIWGILRIVGEALRRAQEPQSQPPPPVVTVAHTPAPATPPPAQAPPAPPPANGPFADYPAWFVDGLHEIGFHETGNNQGIERYIALAHCGQLGQPWCSIFANAMLEKAGIPGTRSPSSQSFRASPNFVQLSGPAPGAMAVFWRGSRDSGLGHVGFYWREDATRVWTLGGNENDMVQIEALPKASGSFGLIGYWWPKAVPLPKTGAVLAPAGSPVHIQSPPDGAQTAPAATANGVQTNIVATMFGGDHSAYGPPIDDSSPGVALPFRFKGSRPRIRVTNVHNRALSVDCDVVDVGPWNINDPYWEKGTRPEAESGTDLGQTGLTRRTNGAGIDLTLAAAKAIQLDGKGLVDWQFITPTQDAEVKVS